MARLRKPSRSCRTAVLFLTALLFLILFTGADISFRTEQPPITQSSALETRSLLPCADSAFHPVSITGYTNLGLKDDFACSDLRGVGELNVSPAIDIDDDLVEIAGTTQHPLVNYDTQERDLDFLELVRRTWGRMSGSSVWLEEYQVFLTVARVYFYNKGRREWSVISFLRAQIHDAQWNHLPGYRLEWQGETLRFPRMFEVPVPYEEGGCFSGPEDPRIVIERGVQNAEPVIVYNMQVDPVLKNRSMFLLRPFSNFTTKLNLDDMGFSEKNWAPFFLDPNMSPDGKRWPSRWLHFVYQFQPLVIVRCQIFSGMCSRIFQQTISASFESQQTHPDTFLRGGSNFEPLLITNRPGVRSFVGFPRTHVDEGCDHDHAVYRPVLTILSTNGIDFWIDYSSEGLTLGDSMLTAEQLSDPCKSGRILFINSIAYFDTRSDRDEMAVSFSVNDAIISAMTVRGVKQFVEALPQSDPAKWHKSQISKNLDTTHRIVGCSIDSATDSVLEITTPETLEMEHP